MTDLVQLRFPFAATDTLRCMPLEFIGASLFTAINRSAAPVHISRMTELSRMNGYRLQYKGRVLTQAHADVWLAIVELFKRQGCDYSGVAVEFHASRILRLLGRQSNMKSRIDIYEWITDMMACAIRIVQPDQTRAWIGPAVFGEVDKNEATGETRYKVLLHPTLCEAFRRGYASYDWSDRRSIQKNELALWLHQYLSAYPEPVPVAQLREHSGQKTKGMRAFRHRLAFAADLLRNLGLIGAWRFDAEARFEIRPRAVTGTAVKRGMLART